MSIHGFSKIISILLMIGVIMLAGAVTKETGYRGIWYTLGQFSEYGDKYSGGLGTYTAKHNPLAVYAAEAGKTFFLWGGRKQTSNELITCISYYDHETGMVPQPTRIRTVGGTDNHLNAALVIDNSGYLWVFGSGRNTTLNEKRYRSTEPFSIDSFELLDDSEARTYPQAWYTPAKGFLVLFTRYTSGRQLYWHRSDNGYTWTEERKLAGFGGHYQSSAHRDSMVITAFNRHPSGNVDRRTDLYFLKTMDQGDTWRTAAGDIVETPLTSIDNPARVKDYASEGLLVYMKDISFDNNGNPVILYILSTNYQPGPVSPARKWTIAHWDGGMWQFHEVADAWHNYDMGSLYIEAGKPWRITAPVAKGPQEWGTGGEVTVWESTDNGANWQQTDTLTSNSTYNHSYVRKPYNAHPDFRAFWCDGNTDQMSPSHLYFAGENGTVRKLPYNMDDDFAIPEVIREGNDITGSADTNNKLLQPRGIRATRVPGSGSSWRIVVEESGSHNIDVFDSRGIRIAQFRSTSATSNCVSLRNLAAGIYTVRLKTDKKIQNFLLVTP